MNKNNAYNGLALALLTAGEILASWGGARQGFSNWGWCVSLIGFVLLLLIIIGWRKHIFRFETYTFTKLLANVVVPRPLNVLFLLDFLMHLSWITDGVLNFMMGDPWIYPLSIGGIGLVVLFITFPDTISDNSKADHVTFVSGISKINAKSTKVTYPDGNTDRLDVVALYNQVPLVRILNLVLVEGSREFSANVNCKLLILKTDAHKQEQFKKTAVNVTEYQDSLSEDTLKMLFGDRFKQAITEDNKSLSLVVLNETSGCLDDVLRDILRTIALLEFPGEQKFIEHLNIQFTEKSCDYDNFEDCFMTLQKAVQMEDDQNQTLCFNLTPGTGIVGSLMTLFSIDSDRKLYFYSQFSETDKNKRIKPVDKMKLPLENLLSQALEKMKGNH